MSVFNLYNEIEQELHFLLPKRGMMLIVFHLYHRMKEHEMERTFTEEEMIHYSCAGTIYNSQCVRICTGEFQFDILQVKYGEKGYYVIDCLNEISFQTFGDYCFSIQQAIGFIMGYMPGGEIFYFSDRGTFYYTDRIRPANFIHLSVL